MVLPYDCSVIVFKIVSKDYLNTGNGSFLFSFVSLRSTGIKGRGGLRIERKKVRSVGGGGDFFPVLLSDFLHPSPPFMRLLRRVLFCIL